MTSPTHSLRLYRHALSGHSHRVELLTSLLGLPVERIDVDLAKGEHKTPAFLAKNPLGQVPVLEDGDVRLHDSNAILVYLARRYDAQRTWYPDDALAAAHVQQWLSASAGPLVNGPFTARVGRLFGVPVDHERAQAVAAGLFGVLEQHLSTRAFLVGAAPTIADLAMYSYTAHAPEGGIDLAPYPALRAWLQRVEGLRGFVAMARPGGR